MFAVAVLAGDVQRDRHLVEEARLLLGDVARRAGRDRPDVHPRNEQRDERQPPQELEERQEPEADEDEAGELGDVRDDAEPREVERDPGEARDRSRDEEPDRVRARASGRASQIVARNAGRTTSARERDRLAFGEPRQVLRDGPEDRERHEQRRDLDRAEPGQ